DRFKHTQSWEQALEQPWPVLTRFRMAMIPSSRQEHDRQQRRAGAEQTMAVCEAGGYILDGQRVELALTPMCKGTQIYSKLTQLRRGSCKTTWHKYPPGGLLDVACARLAAGCPTVVINAASAYHAGGGFLTGGRHALEESICMRSTLFYSLRVAETLAKSHQIPVPKYCQPPMKAPKVPWTCHLPEDGCLLSPDVQVFRGGTDAGYPFLPQVVRVPIISAAMPNCNRQVRDAPVDAPPDATKYQEMILKKFDTMLGVAFDALGRPGALVLPDLGCGAYGNDPSEVGRLLGQALSRQPGLFLEVHLVGQAAFADAAESAAR
ncbi:unnamed protein product, partial [Durusdinium trenchii]